MRTIVLALSLLFLLCLVYTVSADEWYSSPFGGSVTVLADNLPPDISTPNPTNNSPSVSIHTSQVSVSITDDSGMFNYTIEGSFLATVNLNGQTNGTKNATIVLLSYSTSYTWYVNATDGENWTRKTYHFTTGDESGTDITWHSSSFGGSVEVVLDEAPIQSNPNPANGSSGIELSLSEVNITLSDNHGTFNFTIQGSFLTPVSLTSQSNGTYNASITSLNYETTYYWYVNVTDGISWTNRTYHFTTLNEHNYTWHSSSFGGSITTTRGTPQISDVSPTNGSLGNAPSPTLSINITDDEGDCFTVSWSTNASGWTQSNVSCSNGVFTQTATFATEEDTTYWWTVRVNDTDGNWNNQTFHFTISDYDWGGWSDYFTIGQTSIYDVTLDMEVGLTDITSVCVHFGQTGDPGWIPQDVFQDGQITVHDLSGIANHYGEDYT